MISYDFIRFLSCIHKGTVMVTAPEIVVAGTHLSYSIFTCSISHNLAIRGWKAVLHSVKLHFSFSNSMVLHFGQEAHTHHYLSETNRSIIIIEQIQHIWWNSLYESMKITANHSAERLKRRNKREMETLQTALSSYLSCVQLLLLALSPTPLIIPNLNPKCSKKCVFDEQ